jgi:O-antigen/teichoic acid export membrane protein
MPTVRDRFAALGKQTLIYGLSGAAIQGVGLVTLPVYTRVFSPSEFGILEILTVGFTALLVIADSGLTSSAQRSYYDYGEDEDHHRRTALTTGVTISLALALLLTAALLLFARPIAAALLGDAGRAHLVRTVALAIPLAMLAQYFREVMRLKFQAWRYGLSAVLGAATTAAVGVIAVLGFDAGVEGVLIGLVFGNLLAALYGLAVVHRDLFGRFSRGELGRMLAFGLPLIPAAAALWGLSFLDRIMLSQLGSFADTGQYAVASRFAFVIAFLVTAFATAYTPFQLSLWQEDRELEKAVRSRTMTYVSVGLVGVGVVLALFAREITAVVAPGYDEAYRIVGLLVLGIAAFGVSNLPLIGISFMRRTSYIAVYTAIAVAVNAALNFALIPSWGMAGAATATLVAYCLLTVLYYRRSQRLYPTPFEVGKTVKTFLLGGLAMAVGVIAFPALWLGLAVKAAALAVFALAIWGLHIIDESEILELRRILGRFRRFNPVGA